MPSSRYNTIPFVLDLVTSLKPKSILDIGIGYGKWGVLFREYLDIWKVDKPYNKRVVKINGVEAFSKYENSVWGAYDIVYTDNIMNLLDKLSEEVYDLVFMGDVIEHFEKEDAKKLLGALNYKHIIIVTPFQVLEQSAVYNNDYEIHKSSWRHQDLPNLELQIIGNQQVYYI